MSKPLTYEVDTYYHAATIFVSCVIFGVLFIVTMVYMILYLLTDYKQSVLRRNLKIYISILFLAAIRFIWWLMNYFKYPTVSAEFATRDFLARIAFLPLYLSCSFYSSTWLEIVLSAIESTKATKAVKWTMFALDLVVSLLIVIAAILELVDDIEQTENYKDFSVEVCSYSCLLVAIVFLIIGLKSLKTIKSMLPNYPSVLKLFCIISFIFLSVSLMRWIILNLRIWSPTIYINQDLFGVLGHIIGDILPISVILFCIIRASSGKKLMCCRKKNDYISYQ